MTPRIVNGQDVARQMSNALHDIAKLTGFSERDVTRGEAGQILKTWAGRVKVAKLRSTDLRARSRTLRDLGFTSAKSAGDISINVGTRGQAGLMWVKTVKGKFRPAGIQAWGGSKFTPSNRHWKDRDWIDIKEAAELSGGKLSKAIPLARQSAGLARQSVVQIADDMKLPLEGIAGGGISAAGIAKARQAMASDGRRYINGYAQEQADAARYFVTMTNRLPYLGRAGVDSALIRTLQGRVGLFRQSFAKGAFGSIQRAARNYPWMRTTLNAA